MESRDNFTSMSISIGNDIENVALVNNNASTTTSNHSFPYWEEPCPNSNSSLFGGGGVLEVDCFKNNHSHEMNSVEFSLEFQIIIYIIYNAVFVVSVLGNLLVIYVIVANKRLRSVTNYMITNLAIGDLLMALLCVPFSYISVLLQYWPFGAILCYIVSPAQAICVFVSAYTLVALAADRYCAIMHPLRPRLRKSQALFICLIVWIIAVITALPIVLTTIHRIDPNNTLPYCEEKWSDDFHRVAYSVTLMILQYFLPLTVLIFTSTRITYTVWLKKTPGEKEAARDQRLVKAKRKTVIMNLLVVLGYFIAWLPYNILLLIFALFPSLLFDPWSGLTLTYFACHFFAMSHCAYNIFIYSWINIRFRSAFKSVLSKFQCFCCPPLFTPSPSKLSPTRPSYYPKSEYHKGRVSSSNGGKFTSTFTISLNTRSSDGGDTLPRDIFPHSSPHPSALNNRKNSKAEITIDPKHPPLLRSISPPLTLLPSTTKETVLSTFSSAGCNSSEDSSP